jgi:hypothetical protein
MPNPPRLFGDYLPRASEVWQLALDRAPMPVLDDQGEPFLPLLAICLSVPRDLAEMSAPTVAGDVVPADLAREALRRGAREWRVRPGRVLTEDAALAAALREEMAAEGVEIAVRPELAEMRALSASLLAELQDPDEVPDVLSGEGVKLDQVAAFRRAAQDFFAAAPWRWLSDEDLIRIDSPDLGAELRYCVVLGPESEGCGLLFFASPEAWEAAFEQDPEERLDDGEGQWAVTIDEARDALRSDVGLWLREGLPQIDGNRVPVALFFSRPTPRRPDARTLAFFEGLLSALATVTEPEVNSGRWERAVVTHRGPALFKLALPEILEAAGEDKPAPQAKAPTAAADAARAASENALAEAQDRALDLLDAAQEARGRRRILLAREALAAWPEFPEAQLFLAECEGDPTAALALYRQAIEAAAREIGAQTFHDHEGELGEVEEAATWLQAGVGAAETLLLLERPDEALEQLEEVLRYDAEDGQGARYLLADLHLERGDLERLGTLLDRFPDDRLAFWSYTRALHRYRLEGDSPEARRLLIEASRSNPYVPAYLTGEKEVDEAAQETYTPGGQAEAALYAEEALEAWEETPEALDWLDAYAPDPPPPPRANRDRSKRGRGDRTAGSKRK